MIDWRLILIGLAAGLAVSAPMGPTNIFCIRTTLRSGFKPGVYAGLGATLADTAFAAAVAFGLSAVTGLISAYLRSVQLVGGAALVGYGVYALMHPPHIGPLGAPSSLRRRLGGMAAAFVLTISNPGPLVGFLAIFGGASETVMPDTALESVTLAASVMVGCLAWWLGEPAAQRSAFAAPRLLHDADRRTELARDLDGIIRGVAIDQDNFVSPGRNARQNMG